MVTELRVDEELHALIPPLRAEEREGLEAALLKEGCRDALVLWKGEGVLLDGHNRYEVCRQHGLEFRTTEVPISSRDAAKAWVIRHQFSRRNLAPFQRAELALQLEPLIAAKAKQNQLANLMQGGRQPVPQNSAKREPVDTREELAHVAGVSHDTIAKAKHIRDKAPEETKAALRRGEGSIDGAYRATKMGVHYKSGSPDWQTPPSIIQRTKKALGAIDLDPCSNAEGKPNVPAKQHLTEDGLGQRWAGRVYMNPPYGRALVQWVEHLCSEHEAGRVPEAIALVPARTDTAWFRRLRKYPRCFIFGRLKFSEHEVSAPFPSMAVYLGPDIAKFAAAFGDIGDIYELHE